jgi:hypothetical protein
MQLYLFKTNTLIKSDAALLEPNNPLNEFTFLIEFTLMRLSFMSKSKTNTLIKSDTAVLKPNNPLNVFNLMSF